MSSLIEHRSEKDLPVNLIQKSSVAVTVNTKLVKATRRLIHDRFCYIYIIILVRCVQVVPQVLLVAHRTPRKWSSSSAQSIKYDKIQIFTYLSVLLSKRLLTSYYVCLVHYLPMKIIWDMQYSRLGTSLFQRTKCAEKFLRPAWNVVFAVEWRWRVRKRGKEGCRPFEGPPYLGHKVRGGNLILSYVWGPSQVITCSVIHGRYEFHAGGITLRLRLTSSETGCRADWLEFRGEPEVREVRTPGQ